MATTRASPTMARNGSRSSKLSSSGSTVRSSLALARSQAPTSAVVIAFLVRADLLDIGHDRGQVAVFEPTDPTAQFGDRGEAGIQVGQLGEQQRPQRGGVFGLTDGGRRVPEGQAELEQRPDLVEPPHVGIGVAAVSGAGTPARLDQADLVVV